MSRYVLCQIYCYIRQHDVISYGTIAQIAPLQGGIDCAILRIIYSILYNSRLIVAVLLCNSDYISKKH